MCVMHGQVSYFEDFESYEEGDMIAASSDNWATWSNIATQDVAVSNAQASSGTKSLYFSSVDPNGGPQDLLLLFGDRFQEGTFTVSFDIFVTEGGGAYYNFQGEQMAGASFAHNVWFYPDGVAVFANSSGAIEAQVDYNFNEWYTVAYDINLRDNSWKINLNGECLGVYTNGVGSIASIDFYPLEGNSYYIDDVSFSHSDEVTSLAFDAAINTADLGVGGLVGMTQEISDRSAMQAPRCSTVSKWKCHFLMVLSNMYLRIST